VTLGQVFSEYFGFSCQFYIPPTTLHSSSSSSSSGAGIIGQLVGDVPTGLSLTPPYYYLFKLQMGFYPVAVYYNKTQHTNNTPHSNTAYKTTQTIKDTLHTMISVQIQLQLNKLILIKNKYTVH
jgi:hypothetical protein